MLLLNGCTILWVGVIFLWHSPFVYSGLSDEELLDTKLSDHFDVRVRPRVITHEPANISASTWLSHIHSLDLDKGELDLTVWLELEWTDPRLRWDVQQTENKVRQLVLPEDNVWTPDITISNAVSKIIPIFGKQIVVASTGAMTWFQAYRTTIGCATNATADEQMCTLTIGSRRSDITNVDVYPVSENFTVTDEFFSHEWELLDSFVERLNETRGGLVFPFLEVTMNLLHIAVEVTEPTPAPLCMTEKIHPPSASTSVQLTSMSILATTIIALCLEKIAIL
ncbi:neuronal acetylcholine receptor subunit beta-3-like [Liolophura sinensis]|uniref:neuronal acetylcholine receptor subunit beta-3-like n=1 Tax=Liolophura sinensis TaxID=3198878 RepID=UPI0031598C6A